MPQEQFVVLTRDTLHNTSVVSLPAESVLEVINAFGRRATVEMLIRQFAYQYDPVDAATRSLYVEHCLLRALGLHSAIGVDGALWGTLK